jgi:hypothetical protein
MRSVLYPDMSMRSLNSSMYASTLHLCHESDIPPFLSHHLLWAHTFRTPDTPLLVNHHYCTWRKESHPYPWSSTCQTGTSVIYQSVYLLCVTAFVVEVGTVLASTMPCLVEWPWLYFSETIPSKYVWKRSVTLLLFGRCNYNLRIIIQGLIYNIKTQVPWEWPNISIFHSLLGIPIWIILNMVMVTWPFFRIKQPSKININHWSFHPLDSLSVHTLSHTHIWAHPCSLATAFIIISQFFQ